MDRPPPRTLLEQLVRHSRRTIGETCAAFERTAREHHERVTLSPRHLSRWMAGEIETARPVAQRVASLHWGFDFERLIGPPAGEISVADAKQRSEQAWRASQPSDDYSIGAPDWPVWFGVRLGHLLGTVDNWTGSGAPSDALQDLLNREVLMFDAVGEHRDPAHALSRRQALITIAALPLTLATPTAGRLGCTAATEFFLARCAASLTACWHLLRGSDLPTVAQVMSAYLLELEAIASRESVFRGVAARLASQAHRICGIVALHRNQLGIREHHCKQALHFANATPDMSSRASALISLASTYFYGDDPTQAASVYERALNFESALPALQRSRIHAELSVAYGQLGRERDALSSADLAERLYPQHPEQDPSYLYAEFTRASLTLEQGLSYLALAERFPGREYQQVAANVFARMEQQTHSPVPDRIRFEIINHQARTAVLLDDMDAFELYIGQAAEGVAKLGSKQRQKEVQSAWKSAAEAWPQERRLVALGEALRPAITG
ncbi:tetratricopeptide repeat protein [Catelliglobosispora koreensis]|uniref:hypothetical protein n=1 Tax=Catelliglobosispora koreensis TaxID=129052 RepID=UPI0012F9E1EC|nr:hypothetical protein [Catelliglobosispora koreensis]